MTDDTAKYTLYWVSPDRKRSIAAGKYDSMREALDARPSAEKKLREQVGEDQEYDTGSWSVETPDVF